MAIVYVLLACLLTALGLKQFHRWINPITIFIYPWTLMIVFYEFKWIQYYDLTIKTHAVLLSVFLLYSFGALAGAEFGSTRSLTIRVRSINNKRIISESVFKKKIRWVIFITTVIGGLSTILAILSIIGRYGLNFYNKITDVYSDRLLGVFSADAISYIGSVLFIAVILAGIYFTKYGFHPVMIPLLIVVGLKPFTSGARQSLVQCIVMLGMPFILSWKEIKNKRKASRFINKRKERKKGRRILICIALAVIVLAILLVFISNQRSGYVVTSSFQNYASPAFEKVVERVPAVYQLYSYFASPLGVLNEFLREPDFNFGANTLFPFYNVINKFGVGIPVQRYQKFYKIPISINVGTAVRELIEDYSIFGFLVISVCGFIIGRSFKKYMHKGTVRSLFIVCFLFFLAFMSWFSWFLRDANLILALIVGCFCCDYIDKYEVEGTLTDRISAWGCA